MPTKRLKTIAVLHDVLEDTQTIHLELWDLENYGFSASVVKAVDCLTRRKGESYTNYIKGRVSTNTLATIVKIADLEDNMDIKRLPNVTPEDFQRLSKYHEAWKYLTDLW